MSKIDKTMKLAIRLSTRPKDTFPELARCLADLSANNMSVAPKVIDGIAQIVGGRSRRQADQHQPRHVLNSILRELIVNGLRGIVAEQSRSSEDRGTGSFCGLSADR